MSKLQNRVWDQRRAMVLEALSKAPMTIDELRASIAQFGGKASYMTVYRTIQPMLEEGLVEETPWKEGHKKSYTVSSQGKGQGGLVNIVTPNGNRTLAQYIEYKFAGEAVYGIQGALAQVWRYCTFTRQPEQLHLAGSMSPAEVKPYVRELLEFYKTVQLVLEQILLADIWTDSEETAERFGPVDVPVALEQGEAFEKRHGR